MEVKAVDVKNLRETTGAGMMDCKKALMEVNGDFEAAVDWLRKKGLAAASKKSGRVAAEGLVAAKSSDKVGVAIEINSETDFVARNEKFQHLAISLLDITEKAKGDIEQVLNSTFPGQSHDVATEVTNNIAVIGENIKLRRAEYVTVSEGVVSSYIHNPVIPNLGKIAVLVAIESKADQGKLQEIGKKIAMHIAAMKPESLDIAGLDQSKIEREKDIFREQSLSSGKPKEIVEKMIEGRIRKFYDEVVLLEQVFVLDESKRKISEVLQALSKEFGTEVKLTKFVRFELGEGIEQEEKDFAAEVAAIAKS